MNWNHLLCTGLKACNLNDFLYYFNRLAVIIIVFIFSSVSQFVFVFLPGRQPLNFYICSNTLKVSMVNNSSFKLNWQLTVLQVILSHIFYSKLIS